MKKLSFCLMIMVLSLNIVPMQMLASENPTTAIASTKEMPPEVKAMLSRLDEIKAMDKSSLTRSEKKELRKEVRSIKTALAASNHGIYLSVGAIIIIILLLILLL